MTECKHDDISRRLRVPIAVLGLASLVVGVGRSFGSPSVSDRLQALGYEADACTASDVAGLCPKDYRKAACETRCAAKPKKRQRRTCTTRCVSEARKACTATEGEGCTLNCVGAYKDAAGLGDALTHVETGRFTLCVEGPGSAGLDGFANQEGTIGKTSLFRWTADVNFLQDPAPKCVTFKRVLSRDCALRLEAERRGCVLPTGFAAACQGNADATLKYVSFIENKSFGAVAEWIGASRCAAGSSTCVIDPQQEQLITVRTVQAVTPVTWFAKDDFQSAVCGGLPGTPGDLQGHDGCSNYGTASATHSLHVDGDSAVYDADIVSEGPRPYPDGSLTQAAVQLTLDAVSLVRIDLDCDPYDIGGRSIAGYGGVYQRYMYGRVAYASAVWGLPVYNYQLGSLGCGVRADPLTGWFLHDSSTEFVRLEPGSYLFQFVGHGFAQGNEGMEGPLPHPILPNPTHIGVHASVTVERCLDVNNPFAETCEADNGQEYACEFGYCTSRNTGLISWGG